MTSSLQYYQDQFEKLVNKPGPVNELLAAAEEKTKVKKIYIAYGELLLVPINISILLLLGKDLKARFSGRFAVSRFNWVNSCFVAEKRRERTTT